MENIKAKGEIDREVTAITNDSRECYRRKLVLCNKGFSNDGTQYIPTAIEKGAKVILVDDKFDLKSVEIPADVYFCGCSRCKVCNGNLLL